MSKYSVLKLITGEQMIVKVESESREGVAVLNPIVIKQIPTVTKTGDIHERVMVSRYCHYTNENSFFFRFSDVLFIKPLKSKFEKYYEDVVQDFNSADQLQLDDDQDNLLDDIQSTNIFH
jgi:hypothetical protein